ncbi:MAG: polysaccharide biosynthesis tyrosine autokinase [Anaerolineae bacterium]
MEDNLTMDVDIRAYWLIVRRWLWLIVLAAVLAGGTAYAVSRWMVEPIYRASVSMVIQPSSSLSGSDYADILAGQRAAATYAEMLQAAPLQEEALRQAGYTEDYLENYDRPYALAVQPVRDTQVVEVVVESADRQFTANFANTLVETFIEQNQERQASRYRNTQERLAEQIRSLEEDIARLKTRLDETTDFTERAQIETQITQLQDSLSRLSAANQTVQLAELQAMDLVSVIEPAQVPRGPVRPRVMMNALLATAVGGMVALGGVFLREYLDTSVRSTEEAKALVRAPVLGQIWYEQDIASANGTGQSQIVTQRPLSLTAEAYRLLRANLQFAAIDGPLEVILVTSPAPAEGKSTVALNLGLALGAAGKRVILIDADLRRPKIYHYAGIEQREPGLSEILLDRDLDLKNYLRPIKGVENVFVLPPGRLPPNPTEMLGSRRMAEVLDRLRKLDNVVVIIDSPPILAAADTTLLASQVDGVLMVLEAGESDRRMVGQAVEQLQRSEVRLLGSVLNKVPTDGKGGYYYYYYYYSDKQQQGFSWPWSRNKRRRSHRKHRAKQDTSSSESNA